MKIKILISVLCGTLFLVGCIQRPPIITKEVLKKLEIQYAYLINQSVEEGALLTEIANPDLTLPTDINSGQIKKYFKIDDILLALVMRNSMNVILTLPNNFTPTFTGVLVAKQNDAKWTKLSEIKDINATDKNNPYYLLINNGKLLLTVVDQNGAGSGEGVMKVFTLSETGDWDLLRCYYFGESYSDPSVDGDYYAFSVKFSEQEPEPMDSCKNVQIDNL